MRDYHRLQVWQKAHRFTLMVYRVTAEFPADERFGLVTQLRRAAVSVASNIAEGAGRNSDRDYARFIDIALGSINECEYQLLLAHDLSYIREEMHERASSEADVIRRQLSRFADALRQKPRREA